jgi:hypothetical protein
MSDEAQRRLILHMSVSLDGFVATRDGRVDWLEAASSTAPPATMPASR